MGLVDSEKDGRAQKNSVLARAKQMLDEDMDDVKHMNQMMLYSKIVTIRDAQIQEKRHVQAEKEEKDRQAARMREEEARDQERAFILKQIDSLKQEEIEQQQQKKLAADRLM